MFDANVYDDPEKFGLTTVGSIEWDFESYEFHITAVWSDDSGKLFWAYDSGCSCPLPFENFDSVDQLESGTLFDLNVALHERAESARSEHARSEMVELLSRVAMGAV